MCVCVCVCERERETDRHRETETDRDCTYICAMWVSPGAYVARKRCLEVELWVSSAAL